MTARYHFQVLTTNSWGHPSFD